VEQELRRALVMAQIIGNSPQLWRSHAAPGLLHAERKEGDATRRAFGTGRSSKALGRASTARSSGLRSTHPLVQLLYSEAGDPG
jgi:hypothetical protein